MCNQFKTLPAYVYGAGVPFPSWGNQFLPRRKRKFITIIKDFCFLSPIFGQEFNLTSSDLAENCFWVATTTCVYEFFNSLLINKPCVDILSKARALLRSINSGLSFKAVLIFSQKLISSITCCLKTTNPSVLSFPVQSLFRDCSKDMKVCFFSGKNIWFG